MAIKLTLEGVLIYGTMLAYLAAGILLLGKEKRLGSGLFFVGFLLAVAAFVARWLHVQHVPMQNLFEVFLCLGMLAWPISVFCQRCLRVSGAAGDCLVAFIVLFPAGFVFNAEPQKLPPALQSWLFAPHVAAYMAAYMILARAAVQAAGQLFLDSPAGEGSSTVSRELGTYKMVRLGFPVLTLGLVLGAVWGKIAWGDYWSWDPKELWSLVTWLIFAGYLHFRFAFGRKYPRTNSVLVLSGVLAIVITLLWANLGRIFKGMHSYAS